MKKTEMISDHIMGEFKDKSNLLNGFWNKYIYLIIFIFIIIVFLGSWATFHYTEKITPEEVLILLVIVLAIILWIFKVVIKSLKKKYRASETQLLDTILYENGINIKTQHSILEKIYASKTNQLIEKNNNIISTMISFLITCLFFLANYMLSSTKSIETVSGLLSAITLIFLGTTSIIYIIRNIYYLTKSTTFISEYLIELFPYVCTYDCIERRNKTMNAKTVANINERIKYVKICTTMINYFYENKQSLNVKNHSKNIVEKKVYEDILNYLKLNHGINNKNELTYNGVLLLEKIVRERKSAQNSIMGPVISMVALFISLISIVVGGDVNYIKITLAILIVAAIVGIGYIYYQINSNKI